MSMTANAETDTALETVDSLRGTVEQWVAQSLGDVAPSEGPNPEAAVAPVAPAGNQPKDNGSLPDPGQQPEANSTTETDAVPNKDDAVKQDQDQDEEQDEDEEIPEAIQRSINKRIGKEVAKRKDLESQLATLKAQLAAQPQSPEPKEQGDPELAPLQKEEDQAKAVAGYARELLRRTRTDLEGVVAELKGHKVHLPEFSEDRVTEYLETVRDRALESASKASVKRELTVAQRQRDRQALTEHFTAQAHEAYPALADPDSVESKEAAKIMAAHPWLKDVPAARLMIGDMFAGLRLRMGAKPAPGAKAQPAAGKPALPAAPSAQRAPRVPAAPNAAPPAPPSGSAVNAAVARDKFLENPESEDARVNFFKQFV